MPDKNHRHNLKSSLVKSSLTKISFIKKAFSLAEISIVIVIIGILVAGISKGVDLYEDFKLNVRLTTARNLTNISVVNKMNGVVFWLETTLEKSFNKNEIVNNAPITNWYDNNPTQTAGYSFSMTSTTNKPKYNAGGINNLPSIRFDGNGRYLTSTSYRINGNKLTYFVVTKRIAKSAHSII